MTQPTCPEATHRAYTYATTLGMRYVMELRCPVLGVIGYTSHDGNWPAVPTWVGECPCYVKKQAQHLMNAAENDAPATAYDCCGAPVPSIDADSILAGPLDAATVYDDLVARFRKSSRIGGITVLPEVRDAAQRILDALSEITGRKVEASISVALPALPADVTVELKSFQLTRGDAEVTITSVRGGEWVLYYSHEAMRGARARPPFEKEVQDARFKTPSDAAEYAIKWLDSMDAWYEAIESATAKVGSLVGE